MIAYLVCWVIYAGAADLLFMLYRRALQRYLPEDIRPVVQALLGVFLFTPWPIDADTWGFAPAIIAVLFNVLEKDWPGVMKSLLPLLALTTAVAGVGWWRNRRYN